MFAPRGSHQVGVCASWRFGCERDCALPPLETSARLHGDDYKLNSLLNYALVVGAVSFARMTSVLTLLGLRAPSTTDHYLLKEEIEPVLAHMSELSQAKAHEAAMLKGDNDALTIDAGFTSPRNASGATMSAHTADGSVVQVIHRRLTDEGATHSKGLEPLCFYALLLCARVTCYATIVMDGSRELVQPALAAGKRVQGDLWHVQKNWYKWALDAIKALCKRPKPPPEDTADLIPVAKPTLANVEELGPTPRGTKARDWAAARVREVGGEVADADDLKVLKAKFVARARERGLAHPSNAKYPERLAAYEAYVAEKARRAEAAKARASLRGGLASDEVEATAWRREFRSMMRYVAEHTATLRGTVNTASGVEWTDAERGAEYNRLFQAACLALMCGYITPDHPDGYELLRLLKHPSVKPDRKEPWPVPGNGFVKPFSNVFTVLESLLQDPEWEPKLAFLTDARQTFANESYFHLMRKWNTKQSHFSRFYSIGIHCAVLHWNENVKRTILGYKWVLGKSGQLASASSRCWYKVAQRAPMTSQWQQTGWEEYLRTLEPAAPVQTQPIMGCWMGFSGSTEAPAPAPALEPDECEPDEPMPDEPPEPISVEVAAAQAAAAATGGAQKMLVGPLRAHLTALGLDISGTRAELRERLVAALPPPSPVAAAAPGPQPAAPDTSKAKAAALSAAPILLGQMAVEPPVAAVPLAASAVPLLTATVLGPLSGLVVPTHRLPDPYMMPAAQRQRRKRKPGKPKWTAARVEHARSEVAAGRPVPELPTQSAKRPLSGATTSGPRGEGEACCRGIDGCYGGHRTIGFGARPALCAACAEELYDGEDETGWQARARADGVETIIWPEGEPEEASEPEPEAECERAPAGSSTLTPWPDLAGDARTTAEALRQGTDAQCTLATARNLLRNAQLSAAHFAVTFCMASTGAHDVRTPSWPRFLASLRTEGEVVIAIRLGATASLPECEERTALADVRLAACQVDAGAGPDSHVRALVRAGPQLHVFHCFDNDRRALCHGYSDLVSAAHLPCGSLLTALVPADSVLRSYAGRVFV